MATMERSVPRERSLVQNGLDLPDVPTHAVFKRVVSHKHIDLDEREEPSIQQNLVLNIPETPTYPTKSISLSTTLESDTSPKSNIAINDNSPTKSISNTQDNTPKSTPVAPITTKTPVLSTKPNPPKIEESKVSTPINTLKDVPIITTPIEKTINTTINSSATATSSLDNNKLNSVANWYKQIALDNSKNLELAKKKEEEEKIRLSEEELMKEKIKKRQEERAAANVLKLAELSKYKVVKSKNVVRANVVSDTRFNEDVVHADVLLSITIPKGNKHINEAFAATDTGQLYITVATPLTEDEELAANNPLNMTELQRIQEMTRLQAIENNRTKLGSYITRKLFGEEITQDLVIIPDARVTNEAQLRKQRQQLANLRREKKNNEFGVRKRKLLPYQVSQEVRDDTTLWKVVLSMQQKKLSVWVYSPQGDKPNEITLSLTDTRDQAVRMCEAMAPPMWAGKKDPQQCVICNYSFGLLKKGHHCRNCGYFVCKQCSSKDWPSSILPPTYYHNEKFVRICDSCQYLTESFADSLREGKYDSALAIFSTGNINLHCPYTIYKNADYPIHCAAQGGNLELFKWLIEKRYCCVTTTSTDPYSDEVVTRPLLNNASQSVLTIAAKYGHKDIMNYLVQTMKCNVTEITYLPALWRALHCALGAPGPLPVYRDKKRDKQRSRLFDNRGAYPIDIDPDPKGDKPEEKRDEIEAHIYSLNRNAVIPEVAEVTFGKYFIPPTDQRPIYTVSTKKQLNPISVANAENAIKNHYEILEWNNPDFIKVKSKEKDKDKKQSHGSLYYSLPYAPEDITTYQRAKNETEIEIDVSTKDFSAVWNNRSPRQTNGREVDPGGAIPVFQTGRNDNLMKQDSFETHNFYHEEVVSNNNRRKSTLAPSSLNNDEFRRVNAEMPNQTATQIRTAKLLEDFNKLQNDNINSRHNERMKLQEAQEEESRIQLENLLKSKNTHENPQDKYPQESSPKDISFHSNDDYDEPPDYFVISAVTPPSYDIQKDTHQDNIYFNNQSNQDYDDNNIDRMSDLSNDVEPPNFFTSTFDNGDMSSPPDYFSSVEVIKMNSTTSTSSTSTTKDDDYRRFLDESNPVKVTENFNQNVPTYSKAVVEPMLLNIQSPDYYSNTTVAQAEFSNFNNDSFINEQPPPDYFFQEFSNNTSISPLIIDNNDNYASILSDSNVIFTPSKSLHPPDYSFNKSDHVEDNAAVNEPVSNSVKNKLIAHNGFALPSDYDGTSPIINFSSSINNNIGRQNITKVVDSNKFNFKSNINVNVDNDTNEYLPDYSSLLNKGEIVDIPVIIDNSSNELPVYPSSTIDAPPDYTFENNNSSSTKVGPLFGEPDYISNLQIETSNESPPDYSTNESPPDYSTNEAPPEYYTNDQIVINEDESSVPPYESTSNISSTINAQSMQGFSEFDNDNSLSNTPKQVTEFYSPVDFGDNTIVDINEYNGHTDNENCDHIDLNREELELYETSTIRIPHTEYDNNLNISKRESLKNFFKNSLSLKFT